MVGFPLRVLVTGAAGSIGTALVPALRAKGHTVFPTDVVEYDRQLDVTDGDWVSHYFETVEPEVVYHLAGYKQAPGGEEDPGNCAWINVVGTDNVMRSAKKVGARVILASTCKAADPETVYGASKLIAERIVLNAGGTVVRFFNVKDTAGNVFRHWEQLPDNESIPYTLCQRYFISLEQAVELCLAALDLPPGRYAPDPGRPEYMSDVAASLYPDRRRVQMPRRRGDRIAEPLHAFHETAEMIQEGVFRVASYHD